MTKYRSGFEWHYNLQSTHFSPPEYTLKSAAGRTAAHVWPSSDGQRFTWHTYDEQGVGGENSVETSLHVAQMACESALLRAGWHLRALKKRGRKAKPLT